jgi:hypothetical protein
MIEIVDISCVKCQMMYAVASNASHFVSIRGAMLSIEVGTIASLPIRHHEHDRNDNDSSDWLNVCAIKRIFLHPFAQSTPPKRS